MERTLAFLNSRGVFCQILYQDPLADSLYQHLLEFRQTGNIASSCFYAAHMMMEVFGFPREHLGRAKYRHKIKNFDQITSHLSNKTIIEIGIPNHVFVLIYEDENHIYSVDYFQETLRYDVFRAIPVTLDKIKELIEDILDYKMTVYDTFFGFELSVQSSYEKFNNNDIEIVVHHYYHFPSIEEFKTFIIECKQDMLVESDTYKYYDKNISKESFHHKLNKAYDFTFNLAFPSYKHIS